MKRQTPKKVSLFDLALIILIIGIVLAAAFLFFRRTKQFEVVVKITSKNVLYAWDTPPNWFAEYFKEGMVAKDSLGRKTAEIKKIYRYDTGPNNKALYLTLNLKADYAWGSGKFSFEGNPLIIGAPIKIEFPNILIDGLITHIEGLDNSMVMRDMIVETQIMNYDQVFPETNGINSFEAEAITVGEEVKDSLGNTLITVLDKKIDPAKKIVTDANGRVFVQPDPLKKDVYLTLKLRVMEKDNLDKKEYYLFDDTRIMIGSSVPLHLKNISFYPVVTKIASIN